MIKCAAENKIGEFLYEDENVKLRIRGPQTAALPVVPVQTEVAALAAQAAVQPQAAAPAQEEKPAGNAIVSRLLQL